MKRKKRQPARPVWQTLPMGKLVRVAAGWMQFRKLCGKLETDPVAAAVIDSNLSKLPALERGLFEMASTIVPAARAEIGRWLARASGDGVSEFATFDPTEDLTDQIPIVGVIRLWERFLAVGEMGLADDQTRWLSERSREEQYLITRLSRRITVPIS